MFTFQRSQSQSRQFARRNGLALAGAKINCTDAAIGVDKRGQVMAAFRVNEHEGRSCTKCKRPVAVGERYVRQNNGWTRCLRPECGGESLGPPPTTHTYSEESAKPLASPTGQRRRTGGHGYSGGDGFKTM